MKRFGVGTCIRRTIPPIGREGLRQTTTDRRWETDAEHPLDNSGLVVANLVIGEGTSADCALQPTDTTFHSGPAIRHRGTATLPIVGRLVFDPHVLPRFSSRYCIGLRTVRLDGNPARSRLQSSFLGSARRTAAVDDRAGRLTKFRWFGRSFTMMRTTA